MIIIIWSHRNKQKKKKKKKKKQVKIELRYKLSNYLVIFDNIDTKDC